jgi:hypothetical protein
MKIQKQDLYYGAVLQQIAEYPAFKSINKVTEKSGLYLINKSTRLLIKYAADVGPEWSFTFSADDLQQGGSYHFFVALNCGNDSVCVLREDQLFKILDSESQGSQTIKVRYVEGESIRVSGSLGDLGYTVPHNAFPAALLGKVEPEQEKYAWPELGQMTIYRRPPEVMYRSTNRMEDLADLLGHLVGPDSVTVFIGFSTISHKWNEWSEEKLKYIEGQIKYDLGFDGFDVKVQRHTSAVDPITKKKDRPGEDEFLWKVTISA